MVILLEHLTVSDYANKPREMILNRLQDKGVEVISIGKINDIFVGQGITTHYPSEGC
ncbi:hypothetical protein NWP96_05175 [Mycoplasmopsis cynos]|nr:hypothetical protein [Mycoplasmopsis cynos]